MDMQQSKPHIWRAIEEWPVRSFLRVTSLPGNWWSEDSRWALEEAAASGLIVRVRRGLYYKGVHTRYGMTLPPVREIVREVLGDQGVGPSGYSAARMLGLTTQVPAVYEVASLHPPKVIEGALMHRRSNTMRGMLNGHEIAALEVLRAPDVFSERGWDVLVEAVSERIAGGTIRKAWLLEVAAAESHKATRTNALRLEESLKGE